MKILLVTGTPFRSDTNTGKTLRTLFADFAPEELAQLYFSPEIPNLTACSTYYQICERQLLRSGLGFILPSCGGQVFCTHKVATNSGNPPKKNPLLLTKVKSKAHMLFLRELLWKLSRWKCRHLCAWLDEVSPDLIFTFMSDSIHTSRCVEWISRRYACPVIVFVTDDYYYDPQQSKKMFRRALFAHRQKAIGQVAKRAFMLIGCSEAAATEFGKKFGLPYETMLTPAAPEYFSLPVSEQQDVLVTFRYFGNIGLNRWGVLQQLGETIRRFNESGGKAILEVFSSSADPDIIRALTIPNGCVYRGWVQGIEYMRLLETANVAVYVESFDEVMIRRTRLSISTKVADYLGAGKCILAVGPSSVASMEHIEDVSYQITKPSVDEMGHAVYNIVSNPNLRLDLQTKARALAVREHDNIQIPKHMRRIIEKSITLYGRR